MYEEYILTTTRFPLVYYIDPYCDFFLFHTPGKQDDLTVNVHFQLNFLNGIHTKEVDLLEFKRNNDLPPWYTVFQIPYQIKLMVSYSAHTALVQLIYIDTSPDPYFHHMYNQVPHDQLFMCLHCAHNDKTLPDIIGVLISKSLQ